jgi:hypothetical protein
MTKSNSSDYYSSASIKKDLLERSRARAEHRNRPIYKVSGKSAKVLAKVKVPVTIKSSGQGYSTCCDKADCVFCGEIPAKNYASEPYTGFWTEIPKSYFIKSKEINTWARRPSIYPVGEFASYRGYLTVLQIQAEQRVAKGKKAVFKNENKINK